jgi:hypothetical protein
MSFFNSDGSEAAMCGNAALCSTVLATTLGMVGPDGMDLVTGAGTFPTRLHWNLPGLAEPARLPATPGSRHPHRAPGSSEYGYQRSAYPT